MSSLTLAILLMLSYFWISQFASLMLINEKHFFGKHDKILWVVAFLLVLPLAPFAFYVFKKSVLSEAEEEPKSLD